MANIVDISFFFGRLMIAQKAEIGDDLTNLITELEPVYLESVLGRQLSVLFTEGVANGTAKYMDLLNGKEYTNRMGRPCKWVGLSYTVGTLKKSPIANFVYWHYVKNNATQTTGTGEANIKKANADNASPAQKMVDAWNEMVNRNCELLEFLLSNQSLYPEFLNDYPYLKSDVFAKQNSLGI